MKFLFDIYKQKKSPLQKILCSYPPMLSHLLNKKINIFLFKIKYVLFDKIEGMILL